MKLVSWNVEGRLSRYAERGRRGSPEQILSAIRELDGDIVFLPEAYDAAMPVEDSILDALKQLRYECIDVPYDQTGERTYVAVTEPHMILASRYKILRSETIPSVGGIRNMLFVDVMVPDFDQPVRVFGIHLDDKSEINRLKQLDELLPCFAESAFIPVIAMGDFNAMPENSIQARLLRTKAIHFATHLLPSSRLKHILQRLSGMALGTTMKQINLKTGLVSVDSKRRPTTTPKMRGQEWMPSVRMVQIDHIFVSPHFRTKSFKVSQDNGSDHRAISVSTRQKQ